MNRYDDYLKSISPEQWEFLAQDILFQQGYEILSPPSRGPDGGKDLVVSLNGRRYLVSCKHFIHSERAVGVKDEDQLLERMVQSNCNGFIGFYSTVVSTSLLSRLEIFRSSELMIQNFNFIIYDHSVITGLLPYTSIHILSKYGFFDGFMFPFNVEDEFYQPLNCMFCGRDTLENDFSINSSSAALVINNNNEIEYCYGCTMCLVVYEQPFGSINFSQALHNTQLMSWGRHLDGVERKPDPHKISSTYYLNKSKFQSLILQRAFPIDWASWP